MQESSTADGLVAADDSPWNGTVAPERDFLGNATLEYASSSQSRTTRLLLILALLLIALAAPYLTREISYAFNQGRERARVEAARELLNETSGTTAAFPWVAQSMGPSVVHIDTSRPAGLPDYADELESLYQEAPEYESRGQGSGVIIDDEGYVLTNYHVIRNAQRIDVSLSDGRQFFDAKVIGTDSLTDLAVLKIPEGDLIAAPWGNDQDLEVGDWVLAVGNPYGLDRTVTAGIVSAEQRNFARSPYQHFLQTDAAVNPGNSGGPLVNLRGEVVGITTAIFGESYQGISFAIPATMAREVYERLKSNGRVSRGWLGVALAPLDSEIAQRVGVDVEEGVFVTGVIAGGPAEKAGVLPGDIIVEWNGEAIREPRDLVLMVANTAVGTEATLVVLRGGKREELNIDVAERPPDDE